MKQCILVLVTKFNIYYFQNFPEYFIYILFILSTTFWSSILNPTLHLFWRDQDPKSHSKFKGK